ncbi:MAG: thiamine-phosphate kinase [Bacteroidetes bacterium]|nr:thiamine-phosphate kinase [Bacteroidota bacterium]
MGSEEKMKQEAGISRHDLLGHIESKAGLIRGETSFGSATTDIGAAQLVSQELMLEGIDFNLVYFPLKHLGYKLVIRAISGIYASGGKPEGMAFTAGMSSRFGRAEALEITLGIKAAAEKYSLRVKYFDMKTSVTGLTLAATAWGYRLPLAGEPAGPAVNDIICVTGDLGAAYTGLMVLERERRIFETGPGMQPELTGFEYTIGRQLKPELRTDILDGMRNASLVPSASTVIREGLASAVMGICRDNNMGCRLYYDKIPVDHETHRNAAELNSDPVVAALHGGDDYEFLMILPISKVREVNMLAGIQMVGYLTDRSEGCYLVTPDQSVAELKAQGWG